MIRLKINTDTPLKLEEATKRKITTRWTLFQTEKTIIENAALLRYRSHDDITIEVSPDITYRDVVGLRHGKTPTLPPFLALSAISFSKTADGSYFLIPRHSGDWPASMELSGGFLRAAYSTEDTISFIRKRVAEDLKLSLGAVGDIRHLAMFPFPSILEAMVVFHVCLTVTGAELKAKLPEVLLLPREYNPAVHHQYSDLPLHYPTKIVWETFRAQLD